jgi:hypothetical protein
LTGQIKELDKYPLESVGVADIYQKWEHPN